MTSNETIYFLLDYNNNTLNLFNIDWVFIKRFAVATPRDIRIVGNYIYLLTLDNGFYKFDMDMNIISHINTTSCQYRFVFVPVCNCFYLSNFCQEQLDMFDLDLNYVGLIPLIGYLFLGINYYDQVLYVGTRTNSILIIQNNTISKIIENVCSVVNSLSSICIDYESNFAVFCNSEKKLFIFDKYGNKMNKSIDILNSPNFIRFDGLGRMVIGYTGVISILN